MAILESTIIWNDEVQSLMKVSSLLKSYRRNGEVLVGNSYDMRFLSMKAGVGKVFKRWEPVTVSMIWI